MNNKHQKNVRKRKKEKKRKEICYKSSLSRLHIHPAMGGQGELAALQPQKWIGSS
jgi:hypothetical protein